MKYIKPELKIEKFSIIEEITDEGTSGLRATPIKKVISATKPSTKHSATFSEIESKTKTASEKVPFFAVYLLLYFCHTDIITLSPKATSLY